jgi:hypothetical protein
MLAVCWKISGHSYSVWNIQQHLPDAVSNEVSGFVSCIFNKRKVSGFEVSLN